MRIGFWRRSRRRALALSQGDGKTAVVPVVAFRSAAIPLSNTRLSHVHLFLVGWAYYVLVPVVGGFTGLLGQVEAFELIDRYIDPRSQWWLALIAYSMLMPLTYLVGVRVARSLKRRTMTTVDLALPSRILIPIYTVMLLVSTAAAREYLFAGYSEDMNLSVVGPIATLEMALLFQYLGAKPGILRSRRPIALLLTATSIVLLSMGGRLYVVSCLVALYFYWWKWQARDDRFRRRSLIAMIVVPVMLASLGMWRLGVFDLSSLGFYLFAESLFTGISAFTLIFGGTWSVIDTPSEFVSAFLNIVPTVLWPDKASTMYTLGGNHLHFEAPFGAISILTSTIGNFGYAGGLAFFTLVGFVMESVSRNARTAARRALYCYLACLLPFLFFRDPFAVQVKLVITGFVLVWVNELIANGAWRRPHHGHIGATA